MSRRASTHAVSHDDIPRRRARDSGVLSACDDGTVAPHHLIELNVERIARAVSSGESPPTPPGSVKKE
jgi:hypothetical protein